MKHPVIIDWNIRQNGTHLLLLLGVCGCIPHIILSVLQILNLTPFAVQTWADFFVCQWLPFTLALISYLRLQTRKTFSLLPAITGTLVILSYLTRFEQKSVLTLLWVIPLMLSLELTVFLKNSAVRAFLFWSVGVLCTAFISCAASTFYTPVASPFLTLPIPAILLIDVFRRQNQQPLSVRDLLPMLAVVPLSLFLVTLGPMEKFMMYHLMSLGIGFGILFVMLIAFNFSNWKTKSAA